jgi:histidinol-phosphatase (PHP family)
MLQNLHTHSTFCDGKNTPEEMVRAAIEKGFDSIGFSGHAPMRFPSDYDMGSKVNEYIAEIKRLKEKYRGSVEIFLGCELDRYSEGIVSPSDFDYTIASVHHGFYNGKEVAFDHTAEISEKFINEQMGGDKKAYVSLYFDTLLEMPGSIGGDIVGHFDLVSKFSEKVPSLIDTESDFYRKKALETLHALRPFYDFYEVNVGAVGRGYRTSPYPAPFILKEMNALKCKLILTSDCHNADFLDYKFAETKEYIKALGTDELYYLGKGGFYAEKI